MDTNDLVFIDDEILQRTATAIRAKAEITGNLTPPEFPEAIRKIEAGEPAESITIINAGAIQNLTPGNSLTVEVEIEPECASKKWTLISSNPAIVSVSQNAMGEYVVTANAEGDVILTATAGKISTTLSYTVKNLQPVDPENVDFDNLSNIVKAGAASDYLSLGQELNVAYDNTIMPMRIIGFANATVQKDGEDVTVPAIQMEMKYCAAGTTRWGANGGVNYSASALKTYIEAQIQTKFSADFLACLGETRVQFYTRRHATGVMYCKLFAPSTAELGITDASLSSPQQTIIEGPAFQYYQNSTNAKRVKQAIDATGTAQNYWTRSIYVNNGNLFGYVSPSGVPYSHGYDSSYRAITACNFIGKP